MKNIYFKRNARRETWPDAIIVSEEAFLIREDKQSKISLESYNWSTKDVSMDLRYMLCFSSVHSAADMDPCP